MAEPGRWADGVLPWNVTIGVDSVITGENAFKRFRSHEAGALSIGERGTFDGVHFALEPNARLRIGDCCYFTNAILLAELEIVIGNYVVIGWNATIADSDFHPLGPAERIADARALSPLSRGLSRPPIERARVVIEDDVWIGPGAAILKGVRIGAGAWIEPGSVVTRSVGAGTRMAGNPAREIQE